MKYLCLFYDDVAQFDALPKDLIRDAYRFLPQAIFSVSQRLLSKAPDWVPGSSWNVVVSNVRGPSRTVEVTGEGDALMVNDANVVCGGVMTQNATVYLVDSVLMPPM